MNTDLKKLTQDDFVRLLGASPDELSQDCRTIIDTKDLRYRKLIGDERDQIITSILKTIDNDQIWVSGPDKKDVWERGWSENFKRYVESGDISNLTPGFLRPNQVNRVFREYVTSVDPKFEFNVIDVYRRWAFRKYFKDVENIFEFGCGSCQHIPVLHEIFPMKAIHGLDWAIASKKIIDLLVRNTRWNITGHIFNMFKPDYNVPLGSHSAVLTVGTMEQLGANFEPFLEFLLRKKPKVILHMETISELYDDSNLADYLALKWDRKRNYLDGYLDYLRKIEKKEIIRIIEAKRISFGSMFHDSYSLLVWKMM